MRELIVDNYIIITPLMQILEKVRGELFNGKLNIIQDRKDNIRVTCPFHANGMEKHPSCDIYCGDNEDIEYGMYHCFTCNSAGPLYKFIGECFDKGDEFGKQWLISNFSSSYIEPVINLTPIILEKTKPKYINESILDTYQNYHPYMTQRKLTKEVIDRFKIKYDPNTQCVVFPVWDDKDKLYMLTKRSVIDKKFFIESDKEKPVYLLNFIKKHSIDEMTIVESQINALTLWGYGIPAVALFGTGTKTQYDLINKSGVKHIYLCLDGDNAGLSGTKRLIDNLNKDIFIDIIVMLPNRDVNDLTESEFNSLPIYSSHEWLKINGFN